MITDESIVNEKDTSSRIPEDKLNEKPNASEDEARSFQETTDTPASPSTIEAISASDEENLSPDEVDTPPSLEELTIQLKQMTEKAENNWENLIRQRAEYENLQKRMTRELTNARKYALEKFAIELLAVKDSMELGIDAAAKSETDMQTVQDGMALTLKMLGDAMNKFAIVEINPIEEKFDPQWHEAMAVQPTPNSEDGAILHVHQKGYQLNDRLLRPARVIVAKSIQEQPPENPT